MIGITVNARIGIGDGVQFSSLPENFYRTFGEKLLDISRPWFFDHNPYVLRDAKATPKKIVEMWNFPTKYKWPDPRKENAPKVYLSNAEIWASVFGAQVFQNRPRLYKFEEVPFAERTEILLQTEGKSHGALPKKIIDHILEKYSNTGCLRHIGPGDICGLPSYGVLPDLWSLASVVSRARMIIGPDSGPLWIAACYPDVIVKKVRMRPNPPNEFTDWIPLRQNNVHSHWDSREMLCYNCDERDFGFTWSYKRL